MRNISSAPPLMLVLIMNPDEKKELIYDVTNIANIGDITVITVNNQRIIYISNHRILGCNQVDYK